MRLNFFKHKSGLPEIKILDKVEFDGDRYYITPNNVKLPSVTTVLSKFDNEHLDRWRARIGTEEANKISEKARNKGKSFHNVMEKYLNNEKDFLNNANPLATQMFLDTRETLSRINNIYYIETQLWSEKIGVAGQVDLIAEFDEEPAIIDFKTSKRFKKEAWITKYFEQKTAYSLLLEDMINIKVDKIVTIINVDDEMDPQIFVKNKNDYIDSLLSKIAKYKKEYS